MRADRLVSIVLLLQHHGRMSARELAGKLEVSERTVLRDMDALSGSGIPVYAERGATGGWVLAEGYRTSLTGLKKEELQSLLMAGPSGSVLSALGMKGDYETASLKLMAALPPSLQQDAAVVRQRIHVDGAGWHESDESFPYLSLIQEAVWTERKMSILYPRNNETVERIIDPLGLVVKSGIWYVAAAADGEWRSYRISRIVGAALLEQTFTRPETFDLAAYWEQSTAAFKSSLPVYPTVVNMNAGLLPRVKKAKFVTIAQTRSDPAHPDRLEAELDFQSPESACDTILGWGPELVVLRPVELRDAVRRKAGAIASLYAGDEGDSQTINGG